MITNVEQQLEILQRRCATGNVLYVWKAIELCNKTGTHYPEWVRQYLDDVSKGLARKDKPQDALMLSQRDHKALDDHERRVTTISCIRRVTRQQGKAVPDLDVFLEAAERMREKETTVQDWWYTYTTK